MAWWPTAVAVVSHLVFFPAAMTAVCVAAVFVSYRNRCVVIVVVVVGAAAGVVVV